MLKSTLALVVEVATLVVALVVASVEDLVVVTFVDTTFVVAVVVVSVYLLLRHVLRLRFIALISQIPHSNIPERIRSFLLPIMLKW